MARKAKHIHYLYKTTCNVTGRYYIGMHSTSNENDSYMGSGKRLRYSIRKYGVDNHTKEILEYFDSRELLIEAEKNAITEDMINDNNCMNLKSGGEGGWNVNASDEKKKYIIECLTKGRLFKLANDLEFRNKWLCKKSEGHKKYYENGGKIIIPKYWTGLKHSEESKQKISNTKKGTGTGENNSQYGTCWITKNGENKKIKKEELEIYLKEGWDKGRI